MKAPTRRAGVFNLPLGSGICPGANSTNSAPIPIHPEFLGSLLGSQHTRPGGDSPDGVSAGGNGGGGHSAGGMSGIGAGGQAGPEFVTRGLGVRGSGAVRGSGSVLRLGAGTECAMPEVSRTTTCWPIASDINLLGPVNQ